MRTFRVYPRASASWNPFGIRKLIRGCPERDARLHSDRLMAARARFFASPRTYTNPRLCMNPVVVSASARYTSDGLPRGYAEQTATTPITFNHYLLP